MELIHRVHLDPLGGDFQFLEELACECARIAEQRIEMRCRVEDETLAAEGGAEPAQHVVLFEQQHFHTGASQYIRAD